MVDEMFDADTSGALPGQIILDFQGHTTTRDATDNARSRFDFLCKLVQKKNSLWKFIYYWACIKKMCPTVFVVAY